LPHSGIHPKTFKWKDDFDYNLIIKSRSLDISFMWACQKSAFIWKRKKADIFCSSKNFSILLKATFINMDTSPNKRLKKLQVLEYLSFQLMISSSANHLRHALIICYDKCHNTYLALILVDEHHRKYLHQSD
jgi:hypothetical protein